MRVCLINFWDRAGMLHYTAQLANSLVSLPSIELVVWLPSRALGIAPQLFDPHVKIQYVDVITEADLRSLVRLPLQFHLLPDFLAKIRQWEPDVVHVISSHVWLIFLVPWLSKGFR